MQKVTPSTIVVASSSQIKVRPETKYLDPLVCTTRDGVKNVFRDVQVITSIREEQVKLPHFLGSLHFGVTRLSGLGDPTGEAVW